MKIVLKRNGHIFRAACDFCNSYFELGDIVAVVEDPKRPGKLFDVCPTCFAGGPEGIRKRSLIAAERLADWATSEAARAKAIQSEEIIMPAPDAGAKLEAELRAEWGEPAEAADAADNVEALSF